MNSSAALTNNSTTVADVARKYWESILRTAEDYLINAVEHFILGFIAYGVVCIVIYMGALRWKQFGAIFPKPKRVLLVIAHPDDECMFFGPTILRLTKLKDCNVYLLCLSEGNYDGEGHVRKTELWKACEVLGIPSANITLMNCTDLQDNPKERWREDIVARLILHHIEALEIDSLITFDRNGVSRHPNHSSVFFAMAYLSMDKKIPSYCKVYILETIGLIRKYWMLLDVPLSYVFSSNRYILSNEEKWQVVRAMCQHKSQLVWYRRLYMLFSRYTLINTLYELNSIDLELELDIDLD